VPLGVLKEEVISFTPALPSRLQSPIDKLEMGAINKFLCVWDTPFWDTDLQYIGYTPETKGKFNYFINVGKFTTANALMAFAFGDYSKSTEDMSDTEVIDEIMGHLKSIYGDNIPNPTSFLRTKWGLMSSLSVLILLRRMARGVLTLKLLKKRSMTRCFLVGNIRVRIIEERFMGLI
jgi:monoamine oxidase